jgi:hypothetical protein
METIPVMTSIVTDGFKDFDPSGKEQQEQEKAIMLPSFVSTCLAPHKECTGEYTDTFNLFRLSCHCTCHSNRSKSELTEEDKEEGSKSC